MATMMGEMMPKRMEKMGPERMERMMLDMMPGMMGTCFSAMDEEQRQSMLKHCRGMLDEMEEKYAGASAK